MYSAQGCGAWTILHAKVTALRNVPQGVPPRLWGEAAL